MLAISETLRPMEMLAYCRRGKSQPGELTVRRTPLAAAQA